MRVVAVLSTSLGLLALTACQPTMTRGEALEAMGQSFESSRAEALITGPMEVSTSFTIGGAVEEAAEELRDFWSAHAECATVTRTGTTVSVDHGTLDDGCLYEGRPFAGVHTITVSQTEMNEAELTHEFTGLSNGTVSVDGDATVVWSGAAGTRTITHALSWTGVDGATVEATGERTHTLIDAELGLAGGIVVDGYRDWTSEGRRWILDIEGVEMRGQDPVPQAGLWSLSTPDGKSASLAFERLDDDTIEVTFVGERREWVWEVSSEGDIDEAEGDDAQGV